MLWLSLGQSAAATGPTLGFGGNIKTRSGQAVANGPYAIQFSIYSGGDGARAGNPKGKLVWQETYSASSDKHAVHVKDGRFFVQLGERSNFDKVDWSQGNLWLSMNIAKPVKGCSAFTDQRCPGDGEMLPMTKITASPLALDSKKLAGKTADQFLQIGAGPQIDAGKQASLSINKIGVGDLMRLQNKGVDAFTLNQAGDIVFGTNAPNHSISVAESDAEAGGDITISAGSAKAGGSLYLSGGSGAGDKHGVVVIDTPVFATTANDSSCLPNGGLATENCAFNSANLNSTAVLIAGFSKDDLVASVPDPNLKIAGRTIFITGHDESKPFKVEINSKRSSRLIKLTSGNSLGLLWNGENWSVISGSQTTDSSEDQKSEDNQTDQSKQPAGASVLTNDGGQELTRVSMHVDAKDLSQAPLGSIYYDTSVGALRCLEEAGWSDCSAAPDEFVSLSPSYPNAVVRENGIGELSTDTCSSELNINDGTNQQEAVCDSNQTYNYYKWTSQESTPQTRSLFITYKLPPSFKSFAKDSLALTARTVGESARAELTIYRKDTKGELKTCGPAQALNPQLNGSDWQLVQPATSALNGCDYQAGDSLVVQVDLTASKNSTVYISDLDFLLER